MGLLDRSGHHDCSDDDSLEVDPDEVSKEKQRENCEKLRKKAGLPVLELDGLPSAIANKMSNLCPKTGVQLRKHEETVHRSTI